MVEAGGGGPPLAGLRVVVTRPENQAGALVAAFAAAGARVEPLPLLAVVPPDNPAPLDAAAAVAAAADSAAGADAPDTARFDWIAFTSVNAVDAFFDRLAGPLPDASAAGPRTAVVGPATAAALRRRGREPDLVAEGRNAEALAAELAPFAAARRRAARPPLRVLLPQAADARPALAAGLAEAGAEVVAVTAYAKRLPAAAAARAGEIFGGEGEPLGWVSFTSPRIVAHFAGLFGADWPLRRSTLLAASIGAVTTRALARAGVTAAAEAAAAGDGELVAAVVAVVTGRR